MTEAVVHMAPALIPLGNYVTEREAAELLTEDEATYAILAKKQAEEENSGWMENGSAYRESTKSEGDKAGVRYDDGSFDGAAK